MLISKNKGIKEKKTLKKSFKSQKTTKKISNAEEG